MHWNKSLSLVVFALSLSSLAFAQNPVPDRVAARDEMNKGVISYRAARYEDAAAHFQKSLDLDPKLINSRLYLATTYAQMYVPEVNTRDNNANAERAIAEYTRVLDADPKNISSLKGVAYLYMNMKNWEQAKSYYLRSVEADPSDPETYYSVGVIDWTISYKLHMDTRSKAGLPERVNSPNEFQKPFCPALRTDNWDRVGHGITMLDQALKLRPDYGDAMAYLNLLYRERAEMQCNNKASHDADVRTADEWVAKVMAIMKKKAEGGNTQSQQ